MINTKAIKVIVKIILIIIYIVGFVVVLLASSNWFMNLDSRIRYLISLWSCFLYLIIFNEIFIWLLDWLEDVIDNLIKI